MFFGDMPTSAVAYCRVSSAQQEERETIQNQIDFAQNYCKLNNIELQHIYKDDGVTGTLPLNERPAGQELLHDAKNGKFKLCPCYCINWPCDLNFDSGIIKALVLYTRFTYLIFFKRLSIAEFAYFTYKSV
jgi:hypothetical protein